LSSFAKFPEKQTKVVDKKQSNNQTLGLARTPKAKTKKFPKTAQDPMQMPILRTEKRND
jgi:hypothetical protein